MAKARLASMSVEALLELRDDVGRVLTSKVGELHRQLAALGEDVGTRGRRPGRVSKAKGRKVASKYRGPEGETWAGRGARPRWLAALLKEGHKIEEFAIDKSAAAAKRSPVKRRHKK
jgi:DNA-binding protein H-NS